MGFNVQGQGWFAIVGQIVLIFTAVTGALPDRFVQKIPVLGTCMAYI